jgi:hypothetical protein
MDDSRIKTAAELISALISPQAAEAAGVWAHVVGLWPTLVGEREAAHSRILDINNNLLLVEADHPGWIQILQFRQGELLKEVQKRFPSLNVRGIQFRLTQKGNKEVSLCQSLTECGKEKETAKAECDEETLSLAHVDPDLIQDETLRKALLCLRSAMDGK